MKYELHVWMTTLRRDWENGEEKYVHAGVGITFERNSQGRARFACQTGTARGHSKVDIRVNHFMACGESSPRRGGTL
jgi:hypothetical protein